jgi:FxsC-like protein
LYALMKLSYFRTSYELAVHRLARRIVDVAEETVIPVGRRLDFQSQPSAFQAMAPTKQLRISVFSCRQSELPEGRNPDYYGPRRLDWHPYQPQAGRPLAEHAVRLAKQLGFHPSVHEFDQEAEEILSSGEPAAPGLLLLDRWALRDEQRREIVTRFDRRNPPWVSVLEPWNSADPDCVAEDRQLGELSSQTLRFKHREAKPSFQGDSDGLATLEDFDEALPRAAMRAKYAFEDRTKASQGRAGTPRPSLREAFGGEPRAVEPRAVEPRAIESRGIEPRAIGGRRPGLGTDEEGGPPPGAAFGGGEA